MQQNQIFLNKITKTLHPCYHYLNTLYFDKPLSWWDRGSGSLLPTCPRWPTVWGSSCWPWWRTLRETGCTSSSGSLSRVPLPFYTGCTCFFLHYLMSTSVRIIHEIPVDIPGNQCITITHFRHVVCMVCKCMSSYVQVYDRYSSWNIYVVDMLSLMYCNCDVLVDQGWSQNPPVGWCHVAESVRPRRL